MAGVKRWLLVVAAFCACGAPVAPAKPAPLDADATAAAMVDAFTNSTPVLAGDRVVFVSNRDGLPQLYVGERAHPERPPRRLPTPAERVVAPGVTTDGEHVV